METNCEFCALYYVDDDGYGECQVNLDEDEMFYEHLISFLPLLSERR